MGVCYSTTESEAEAEAKVQERLHNRKLDKLMLENDTLERSIHKLLLLGAGESGKSTLFKQLMTIYGDGFSADDKVSFVRIIHCNVLTSMQSLIAACTTGLGGEIFALNSREKITSLKNTAKVDEEVAFHIKSLWQDPGIVRAYQNRNKFQLMDSAAYFFDRVDEISRNDFLPSQDDILRSRVRTTGIVENEFSIMGNKFKLFDVGGQRNERKKWIHCFQEVTAVLFVGVLSEYNQTLYEDEYTNRMMETLNLFEEIINSRWFDDTAMILFLNKSDLFAEKIQTFPLNAYPPFKDYDDTINSYDEGCRVIQEAFMKRKRDPEKPVYPHITCATNTDNVAVVFDAVKDIVLRKALGDAGLV